MNEHGLGPEVRNGKVDEEASGEDTKDVREEPDPVPGEGQEDDDE